MKTTRNRRFDMTLSAPHFVLRREAKLLSRKQQIPLHQALDRIARREGYTSWSLLISATKQDRSGGKILSSLVSGDLMLLAARPGQGKTLLSLEMAVAAMAAGRPCAFFSLEYNEADMAERLIAIGEDPASFNASFRFDNSDEICADYVVAQLEAASESNFVVIDYLQLLDQKRNNADLTEQVSVLKDFAMCRGHIIVFLSQIDRCYDLQAKKVPDLGDVRLPNPLDLQIFDKTCFLNKGALVFAGVGS